MAYTHSQSEYAKHLGISQPTVFHYLKSGKLDGATRKKGKRIFIDPEKADELLPARLSPQLPSKIKIKKPPADLPGNKKEKPLTPTEKKIINEIKANGNYKSYQGAHTARENIKLRQDVIDLKKVQGELIPAEQVKREADQVGRTLKDQLMSLKDRVSALVAPVTDEFEIKQIIGKEVEYTLRAISSRLVKHVERR